MSILNVNQIQPVGSGQTVTISATNIDTGSATVTAGTFTGNLTGNATGLSGSPTLSGITSVSTTNLTVNGNAYPSAGPLSNRNLIINGAMNVAQRGTSFAVTTSDTYTVDRFQTQHGGSFDFNSTLTQSSTAPAGFTSSLKVDVTSTSTPTATQNGLIAHKVEAQNLQHLQYGTSGAQTCTLTFWVRSNKTGTYCLQILQQDASQYQLHEYSISSADTWEQKTITIVGNTATAINNDNGKGFDIRWHLACGSDDHVAASSTWTGSSEGFLATSNQVNLFDSTSNEWYLAGVQLEVGSVATPFEHRSYGQELALCQRYYKEVLALQGFQGQSFFTSHYGTTSAVNMIEAGLYNMRASVNTSLGPTGNTGNVQYYSYSGTWTASTLAVTTIGVYPHQQIYLYATADGDGRGKLMRRSGASDPAIYVEISAEL